MTPMDLALAEAAAAAARGEVPVGAVVTDAAGQVLAAAGNEVEARHDASAHAEMLALRAAAARIGSPRLVGCTLTVTLEPCPMCAQAASFFRVKRWCSAPTTPRAAAWTTARASSPPRRATTRRRWWAGARDRLRRPVARLLYRAPLTMRAGRGH